MTTRCIIALITIPIIVIPALVAKAHVAPSGMVYPKVCCNSAVTDPNGDCAPIDKKYVTERPDGYHVNLPVGSHPQLRNKGYSGIVPYSATMKSKDGQAHMCLGVNGAHWRCFFMPPKGS